MVARWDRPGSSNWFWPTSAPSRAKATTPTALAASAVSGGIHQLVRRMPLWRVPTPNPNRLSTSALRPNGVCRVRSARTPATNPTMAPRSGPPISPARMATSSNASGRTWRTCTSPSTLALIRNTSSTTRRILTLVTPALLPRLRDRPRYRGVDRANADGGWGGGGSWSRGPLEDFDELEAAEVDGGADRDVLLDGAGRSGHRTDLADRQAGREAGALQARGHHRLIGGHVVIGTGVDEADLEGEAGPGAVGRAEVTGRLPGRVGVEDLHPDGRRRVGDQQHGGPALGHPDHSADQAGGGHHRHVLGHPGVGAPVDFDGEVEVRRRGVDDRCRHGGDVADEVQLLLVLQRLVLQLVVAGGQPIALLLGHLAPQPLVLRFQFAAV